MRRLTEAVLPDLPAAVRRPGYERASVRTGIVHLGIGAFHRAHMAAYTDEALAAGDRRWGIAGASLRSPETRDALAPQDGLYTLDVRDGGGESLRVIGSVTSLHVAPEDPAALVRLMTDPAVRIVSLTVTEKGYCHRPATGDLDEDHPDIRHDLAEPGRPRSAPGFLVAALAARRAAGVPPFTVLSCDNLPANGETTHRVLSRFAALRDPELGRFVEAEIACPSTMIDRIVPATTDIDRERVDALLGAVDRWPVLAEPFSQWVIADRFPARRPDWPGVTFAGDVAPFELAKLRLLNGSHSTLAYLGYLSGRETVADAMGDPGLARLVGRMMEIEVAPTLPALPGLALGDYRDSLLARFRNPALRHRTWQIAADGSQKLPQRLLGTVRDNLAAGRPIGRLALGVAAWIRFAGGTDEAGAPIDVRDPLAAECRALAGEAGRDPARLASAFMTLRSVFGGDLPADPRFRAELEDALRLLLERGAAAAAEARA